MFKRSVTATARNPDISARHHLTCSCTRLPRRQLPGVVHTVKGAHHLKVLEQVPAGASAWQPVADGKWMPADGGASNGGQWLHEPGSTVVPAAGEVKLSCPVLGLATKTATNISFLEPLQLDILDPPGDIHNTNCAHIADNPLQRERARLRCRRLCRLCSPPRVTRDGVRSECQIRF